MGGECQVETFEQRMIGDNQGTETGTQLGTETADWKQGRNSLLILAAPPFFLRTTQQSVSVLFSAKTKPTPKASLGGRILELQ